MCWAKSQEEQGGHPSTPCNRAESYIVAGLVRPTALRDVYAHEVWVDLSFRAWDLGTGRWGRGLIGRYGAQLPGCVETRGKFSAAGGDGGGDDGGSGGSSGPVAGGGGGVDGGDMGGDGGGPGVGSLRPLGGLLIVSPPKISSSSSDSSSSMSRA